MKTKNIYLQILTLFVGFLSNAQEVIISIEQQNAINFNELEETAIYFKDTNNLLNKYVGNWIFNDGTHFLEINITKHIHELIGVTELYESNDYEDYIGISFIYKLNNIEKYNSNGIFGNSIISDNKVRLTYYEPSLINCARQKQANLTLEFVENFPNSHQLNWTRTNTVIEGLSKCQDGTYFDNTNFLIPANLILTKQ